MTQRTLASEVPMAPDALSRALNGQRGFSIIELERISEVLGANLTWLITGKPDPHAVKIAARHEWNANQRTRSNPDAEADQAVLDRVTAVYNAAYPDGPPTSGALPRGPEGVAEQLGSGFVREFAEKVEQRLGVDVVRVPDLGTDYAITIGERHVIVLNATPSWFRSNWSLAHELGHLSLRHRDEDGDNTALENSADGFAAQLLLPSKLLKTIDWAATDEHGLAEFLWRSGVSSHALRNRLNYQRVPVDERLFVALQETTPTILSRFGDVPGGRRAVIERQQLAAQRRFPLGLLASLTGRVGAGTEPPDDLAWALGVTVDDVDFPEAPEEVDPASFDALIDGRPTLEQLREVTQA